MRNHRNLLRQKKGDVLIEAVLAIAITGIVVTGIVVALTNSISQSNFTRNQNLASNYAQQGLDIARNMKENSFASLSALGDRSYCLGEGETAITTPESASGCDVNIGETFFRSVYINSSGEDGREAVPGQSCQVEDGVSSVFIASIVAWTDSKCTGGEICHKVELNSCFVDLNKIR